MSVAVPAYKSACIAPDRSGSSVWLIGVSPASEGRLEAYLVNLAAGVSTPTASLVSTQTDVIGWSSAAQRACFTFPSNGAAVANSPVLMQQFGAKSYFTNVYPNGTIDLATNFQGVGFISPKAFSLSASVQGVNWYTALANITSATTNSAWTGLRLNGTEAVRSSRDFILTVYPTATPILSVGTFVPASNTPAQGYHIVFDSTGSSGTVYTTLSTASAINTGQDRILSLSNGQPIDMGGIVITPLAIPLTNTATAYILDQASDGSTVLYTITPSQGAKLSRVSVQGNVPPFTSSMSVTVLNSQIILYGASSSSTILTSTFNSFDTIGGTWTGPGLVKAAPVPTQSSGDPKATGSYPGPRPSGSAESGDGSSKTPLGAIIGGVVGGLVLIAIVAFLVIRHRRKSSKPVSAASTNTATPAANAGAGAGAAYDYSGKNTGSFAPAGQQPVQPVYNPHQSVNQAQFVQQPVQAQPYAYVPPVYGVEPTKEGYPAPLQQQQQQQAPEVFQVQHQVPQPSYSYAPPIVNPAVPSQGQAQPTIFRPQSEISNPSYTQAIYSPTTPQTPFTNVSTPSTGAPSSPQYVRPPQNQGYVS